MSGTMRWPIRMRALAAGAATALLLAATSPHTGLGHHDALDGPTTVYRTSGRYGAPTMEPAISVELPQCAACVFQLQALCAGVPLPQLLPGLIHVAMSSNPATVAIEVARFRPTLPRGPPAT